MYYIQYMVAEWTKMLSFNPTAQWIKSRCSKYLFLYNFFLFFVFPLPVSKMYKNAKIWSKHMVWFMSYEHFHMTSTSQNDARQRLITILHTSGLTMFKWTRIQNLIQIYHVVQELWAISLNDHNLLKWCSAYPCPSKRLLHMAVVR